MKKTLITLAALAMASVAPAATYTVTDSYTLADFENGTLTLDHALDFTKDFEISGTITIGSVDANQWGTPLITTNTSDHFGGVGTGGFKLYLAGWDNGVYGEDALTSAFQSSLTSGEGASTIKGVTPGETLTFTYTYVAETQYGTLSFSDGVTTDSRHGVLTSPAAISALASEIPSNGSGWAMDVTVKTVPEPTTATLSLLALAGLAARRRRK